MRQVTGHLCKYTPHQSQQPPIYIYSFICLRFAGAALKCGPLRLIYISRIFLISQTHTPTWHTHFHLIFLTHLNKFVWFLWTFGMPNTFFGQKSEKNIFCSIYFGAWRAQEHIDLPLWKYAFKFINFCSGSPRKASCNSFDFSFMRFP